MKKIVRLAMVFFLLFIFSPLSFPRLVGAQIFSNQEQSVATPPDAVEQKVWDPLERSNRKVFSFNDLLYTDVVKPLTVVYDQLPPPARKVFHNGFQNLDAPSRVVNLVLQGKPHRAGEEMERFVINSTLGVGGMFDIAQNTFGVHERDADFGQTLGTWCVAPGPYLVVPVLGPSNTRDLTGLAADSFMDPLYWVPGPFWLTYPVDFVKYVNKASEHIDQYETMKKGSLDPYVAMRNAYMQHREEMIRGRSQQPVDIRAGMALAQARAEEQRRRTASPPELAQALREAARNESSSSSFDQVLQKYPQLSSAVAAREAIARYADFRPDWGQENRERLSFATEIICRDVARGDLFTQGRMDSRVDRISEMARKKIGG